MSGHTSKRMRFYVCKYGKSLYQLSFLETVMYSSYRRLCTTSLMPTSIHCFSFSLLGPRSAVIEVLA